MPMQSLWMLVASLLFACMGVCVKFAAQAGYSAAEIVFYRSGVSLLLMFGLVRWRGIMLATPHWRFQLQRGVSGFVALSLYFWSITLLPLATAVTLNYTAPIFLALLLVLVGKDRVRPALFAALALGLAGVILLLRPTFSRDLIFGGLIGLASGMLAAVAYFNVRELGQRGETEARTVFYFSLTATIGSLGWLAFSEMHRLDLRGGLLLFGVASFATVAQLAMTRAYKRGKTLVSASLAYSTVVFASLLGVVFWHEHLTLDEGFAMLLIVLSGMATNHASRPAAA